MKKAMRKRLLALILACMMMVPATAMADNDIVLPAEEVQVVAEVEESAAEESAEATEESKEEEQGVAAAPEEAEQPSSVDEPAAEETPSEVPEDPSESPENPSSEEPSTEAPEEQIPDGLMEKNGKLYCYENNALVKGLKTLTVDGKKATYYFDKNGAAITGLKKTAGNYYYFQKNHQAYTGGFLEIKKADGESAYYYFQEDGTAYTRGYKAIDKLSKADASGKITDISDGHTYKYYFRPTGQAYTKGLLDFVHTNGKKYQYYFQADGKGYTDGLKKVKRIYSADANGKLTKQSDGDYHYYYFKSSGIGFNKGLLEFVGKDGKTNYFYFQKNGQAYTKGYKSCKKYYKADSNHNVKKVSDSKTSYYYFRPTGKAYTGGFLQFVHTNGKTYNCFFQANGKASTSMKMTISKRCKADKNGNITNISDSNKYGYSFNSKGQGSLIQGWEKVDGSWSWYNKSTGIREFTSNEMHTAWNYIKDRSSGTSYYVVVDTANCRTFTFKGSANNWTPLFLWKCSPGKPSTPTVKGTYSIYGRGYSFSGKEDYTCYYYTQFYGNYLFHSVLYYKGTMTIRNGTLGQQLSHGCVRLAIENAKWFYDNLGYGTKVYIY